MKRRLIAAGNWKLQKGVAESVAFVESLLAQQPDESVETVIFPPFTSLPATAMACAGSMIGFGGQNIAYAEGGAYTGEISGAMLSELGCCYALAGHSERRSLFGDDDDSVARRAKAGQDAGLTMIYCIGESLEQREAGETFTVLEGQTAACTGLDPRFLIVAYEPIWAIGTGKTASPEQAQEAHAFIRGRLAEIFDESASASIRILYGGSVKPGNAAEIFSQADVDGGLVGGASLDPGSFSAIIQAAASAMES